MDRAVGGDVRRLLLTLALCLIATNARATKTIIIIGDSLAAGSEYNPGVSTGVSRYRVATSLQSLVRKFPGGNQWKDATVEDWTVPGTEPTEWYLKPGKASECLGANNPFDCCTGSGAGSNCICDGSPLLPYHPHLQSACNARDPIINHIRQGADLVLIHTDGVIVNDVTDAVDDLATLVTALDAVEGTVLISSPSYMSCPPLEPSPGCLVCTWHQSVHDEMESRTMITGPDFFDGPVAQCGPDFIHTTDTNYQMWAWEWSQSILALP